MNSVSFKSVYAIPHDKVQNPLEKNYVNFMTETANLRDKNQKSKYDTTNDIYFVYIRDENDKKFEAAASQYGIIYRKADNADLNNAVTIKRGKSTADKDLSFLMKAIQMGAKFDVANNGKYKNITLYDDNGEKVFAKYTIDKTKGLGGKLVKKYEYLDGKPDGTFSYGDNGEYKKSVINGREFTYDESGKPISKDIKNTYLFLQNVCKKYDLPTDFVPDKYKAQIQ